MFKKPYYLALGSVLLISLVLLNLPGKASSQLKLAISSVFLPIFGLATSSQEGLTRLGNGVAPRRVLQAQVEHLQRENQQLKLEAIQGAEAMRENERLRAALGWGAQRGWKTRLARVIAREPSNWWKTMQIDLGREAGVVTNAVVLTADGLVGRVEQVGAGSARVVLLGDPNCRVSAVVEETRDVGVISAGGDSIPDQSLVEMTYLSRHSQVKPGNRVSTSGLGGIFPKGIPIGRVTDTNSAGFGLFTEARVKLSANLRDLEEVWVLLP